MTATVRLATTADVDGIVELRAEMFRAMGADEDGLSAPEWRTSFADWLSAGLARSLVAVCVAEGDDGSLLACALGEVVEHAPSPFNASPLRGHIGSVVTVPDRRREGLARRCMVGVIDWFRDSTDVQSVDLTATDMGLPLYETLGFERREYPTLRLRIERRDQ